jgi:hypothetical protein
MLVGKNKDFSPKPKTALGSSKVEQVQSKMKPFLGSSLRKINKKNLQVSFPRQLLIEGMLEEEFNNNSMKKWTETSHRI